jgi:DNA segregation ATPase FtsK/SpoIIIE-like protein
LSSGGSGSGSGASGSSGSSSSGGSSGGFSAQSADKKDEKSADKPAGGFGAKLGRVGALLGRGGGDKKDDKPAGGGDKKDDKPAGGGGVGAMFGRGGGDKKDDKPAGGGIGRGGSDKKDDKPAGSVGGVVAMLGRVGAIVGRGGGDKKDDKPAGGGIGRGGNKKEDKAADKPAGGGLLGRGSGDKKDDKPAGGGLGGGGFSNKGGSAAATASASSAPATPFGKGSKAPAPAPASGGGFGSALLGLFRVNAQAQKPPARPKQARTPVVDNSEGLTLDNWLDIIGVGLMFAGLLLFASALSAERAAISGLLEFLGELLGWGAIAVPFAMMGVGLWLIVRHFGDEAPKIDPIQVAGVGIAFVTLLTVFQYIESFNYPPNMNWDLLQLRLRYSYEVDHAGGGAIGATLYYALITNVTEIGGVFVLGFFLLIAVMLMTRSTASDLVAMVVGSWRSYRAWTRQQAIANRAKRQLRAQERAKAKPAPEVLVSAPTPEALPTPVSAAALPEPSANERGIRLNIGGEAQTLGTAPTLGAPVSSAPQVVYYVQATPPSPDTGASGGGLFGRKAPKPASGGLLGMLGRGNTTQEPPPPPLPLTPLPLDDVPPPVPSTSAPAVPSAFAPPPSQATPATFPASASYEDEDEDDVDNVESAFLPSSASKSPSAPAPFPPYEERASRLDAIRGGNTAPPVSPSYTPPPMQPSAPLGDDLPQRVAASRSDFTLPPQPETPMQPKPLFGGGFTPSQLPSAQPSAQPMQQSLAVPVASAIVNQTRAQRIAWKAPDYRTLLSSGSEQEFDRELLLKQAKIIEDTLTSFGANGRVVEINTGPVITQFGVEPDYVMGRNGKKQRVKVGAIAALDKDLQLALGAKSIRVEAPVPGKGYVGVEVPNKEASTVRLRDVMESPSFSKHKSPLAIALGQSVSGVPISADLASMPHLLIAGTTGSGKSVCVNAVITSIISRHTPDEVKFIMVDPKRVELTGYNGIPHLIAPVVVELERIVGVLKWVTREMDDRYNRFMKAGARNIEDYNRHRDPNTMDAMPYIVVIIDELADLMMLAPEETERTITRIAALARATGIHLVIATQRPSVDVVTGLIKANFPARIAFAVAGSVDSRVILDQPGAERLLGRGDMLYISGDSPAPLRLQGVYVSDMEIQNIVRYWKLQALSQPEAPAPAPLTTSFAPDVPVKEVMPRGERVKQQAFWDAAAGAQQSPMPSGDTDFSGLPSQASGEPLSDDVLTGDSGEDDEMYEQAVELVRRLEKASVSLLQRRLRIGYTRAARLIDVMEARGVIGPAKDGSSKPRDVL